MGLKPFYILWRYTNLFRLMLPFNYSLFKTYIEVKMCIFMCLNFQTSCKTKTFTLHLQYTFLEFLCRNCESYANEAILSKLYIHQHSQVQMKNRLKNNTKLTQENIRGKILWTVQKRAFFGEN